MSNFKRTFRKDRLYFRYLKPKRVGLQYLDDFAMLLEAKGFIDLLPGDRYQETDKLTDRKDNQELFKLITKGLKHDSL